MWHERTSPLDPSSSNQIGWEKGREKLEREKEGERKEGERKEGERKEGILERDAPTSL